MMSEENTLWPGWKTVRRIGQGSFGSVYEIQREVQRRTECSALKVISIPQSSSEVSELRANGYDDDSIVRYYAESLAKIEDEYAIMAEMKGHPNVVRCEDIRTVRHEDGIGWDVYIKMELLTPLLHYASADMTEEQIIRLGINLCSALQLCQAKNVIHRDIKPANIFVSRDGVFKLGDFGIARTMEKTIGGTKIGTYDYMAPEVYNNRPYHMSADIYSLGLVMYWFLNGRRMPFIPEGVISPTISIKEHARMRRFSGEPLSRPAYGSEWLQQVVLKACAFAPRDRYASAGEMKLALETPEEGTEVQPTPPDDKMPQWLKTALAAAGAVVLLVLGVYGPKLLHTHTWNEANCTGPEICQECGETRGVPLEHQWLPADCTSPKTCKVCGAVQGEPVGHLWTEATYESPRTCLTCGAVDGEPLPLKEKTNEIMARSIVGAGRYHTVVMSNGGVMMTGKNDEGQLNLKNWGSLTAIAAGDLHTVGLRSDGTVMAAGQTSLNQCDVAGWTDVVAIAAGDYHTVGLCRNGALLATGWDSYGQCRVDQLKSLTGGKEITAVAAGYEHTVALCADGTVAAIGRNDSGQCNVSGWTDIVAVYAGTYHTAGLKKDGTVVAVGKNDDGQCNVAGWTDIVNLCAGDYHTVGVKSDGTVVAVGRNAAGQCNLNGWNDIVAVAAGRDHTVGIKRNGTVVAEGRKAEGQCKVDKWENIQIPEV